MLKKILAMFKKESRYGVIVFAPTAYAKSLGLRETWVFDCDKKENPILQTAHDRVRWEIANGTYAVMFDRFVTKA